MLTRSLYGASAEIREKFFSAMSSGASTMIKEDLEVLGELPLAEVETARNETLAIARKLAGQGVIDLKTIK